MKVRNRGTNYRDLLGVADAQKCKPFVYKHVINQLAHHGDHNVFSIATVRTIIAMDIMINATSITITSLTVTVARSNSPHMEKSISCANARVSASMDLLYVFGRFSAVSRLSFGKRLTQFKAKSQ